VVGGGETCGPVGWGTGKKKWEYSKASRATKELGAQIISRGKKGGVYGFREGYLGARGEQNPEMEAWRPLRPFG